MFCNKCGNEVGDNAKFCPKCGAEFQTTGKKNKKQAKPKKGIIIACIGILVLIIGGVGLFTAFFPVLKFERGAIISIDGVLYHLGENGVHVAGREGDAETVVIPSKIKVAWKSYQVSEICEMAFQCDSLTSVEIPNSVTKIGCNAFASCTSLTSVEIPNSVTEIGEYAFQGCSSLTSVRISENVTIIPKKAFLSCRSLTSVEIPNGVTEIGKRAFMNCTSLTSVEIPNSVTEIGGEAFAKCDSLTYVKIPASVTKIADDSFSSDTLIDCTQNNTESSTGEYTRFDFVSEQAYKEYLNWGDTSGLKNKQ